ncbi:poly(3-hydroxybutyrate) depolymerase [Roseiarcus fermentans]|uniref:Poly(3-hydroxybutyrate) depolymerase n=1 Tax=Roseiarcus fermentans TaxID=1473586 RepID=A0A366F927_9HYPH|nr:polyhydroxyalkanoate depolymerase [Roseiarcus fermentans]RBP11138.1 poly(3-hydroxybutyrate) depolymerase [Roseiarcus fermentans]
MFRSYSYQMYEMVHASLAPARAVTDTMHFVFRNPWNPLSNTTVGKNISAAAELFERMTRRYGKPTFGLDEIEVDGVVYPILEDVVWSRPFCNLLHFVRPDFPHAEDQPKLLIVAPMSGHYATLLRGTVEALLPYCDIYITDWTDARLVPVAVGTFDLDDYIDYLRLIMEHLGPGTHTLGVCQPGVPLLAAVAIMEANGDPNVPASMTFMGSPIDTRRSPTEVNKLAEKRGIEWFRRNVLHPVPFPYPGMGRQVYPGFLQLSGFMAMNLDRHVNAHMEMFNHLVEGDGDSAEKHRDFYDEYLAVMDMDAAFYMQTIEKVFIQHALPKGELKHRGQTVDCSTIRRVALMTIEGEKDDIAGIGQSQAAHDLCVNIPDSMKTHYLQLDVGHYGIFNGSRFRNEILPRMRDFWAAIDGKPAKVIPPARVTKSKTGKPIYDKAAAVAPRRTVPVPVPVPVPA